jgi:hypothetical protein
MKTIKHTYKGQTIVLFVVALVGLVAMAALLLDGGNAYLSRRTAQAAADAGALAGARQWCLNHKTVDLLRTEDVVPIVNANHAVLTSNADVSIVANQVVVRAHVIQNSYFAQVLGVAQADVTAEAAAGCYAPGSAEGVLPVGWACRNPLFGSESPDCDVKMLDWTTEFEPLLTGSPSTVAIEGVSVPVATPYNFDKNFLPQLYILMDSDKTIAETCIVPGGPGTMDCDLNNDGKIDILGGGDTSWLDLDGKGGGSADLVDWVNGTKIPKIRAHTWLGGKSGVNVNVYHAVDAELAKGHHVFIIPIFNALCDGNPITNAACQNLAHGAPFPPGFPLEPGQTETILDVFGSPTYFHIVGFNAIYVTCSDPKSNNCPGRSEAEKQGIFPKNYSGKTIEGYFIQGYPFTNIGGADNGVDMGLYIYSLSR